MIRRPRGALVAALVNDANAVVAAIGDVTLDEPAASAVALLALVAGQDVEPAEDSDGTDGRWRIACKLAGDWVISVTGSAGAAYPQVRRGPPGRVSRAPGRRPGHRDHH